MNKSPKNTLEEKILELKGKREAVILAHNYQLPEVQDIADFVGDSLELSRKAAKTDAKVIVFCGVDFMAQTAAILSPDKKVLLPDLNAGCPLAEMITPSQLKTLKKKHPDAKVVSYVNTTAEIKAESDISCTSANSIKVVNSIPKEYEIIFIPDKYLCDYTSKKTKRKLICWGGYCPSHVRILANDIKQKLQKYPKAKVVVHPECTPDVLELADDVTSTSGILRFVKESKVKEFIIGTEVGMIHRLKKENPDKIFFPASELAICPTMKLTTLEKVLWSLEDLAYQVKISESIRRRAKKSIDGMLAIS